MSNIEDSDIQGLVIISGIGSIIAIIIVSVRECKKKEMKQQQLEQQDTLVTTDITVPKIQTASEFKQLCPVDIIPIYPENNPNSNIEVQNNLQIQFDMII
ncbi:Hypothetical_protein [Hexamita inflata]|uniref:Hypothetical_protein n=1 Tax=Hexamita inflata TaxID=28002 RepID=A0AA86TXK3_9EUKA|nr:Hypothetical protein HINF_LOCUS12363 [Hexamita inflata]